MKEKLEAAGSSLDNMLQVTICLADMENNYAPMNEAYKEYFPENPPARSCFPAGPFRRKGNPIASGCCRVCRLIGGTGAAGSVRAPGRGRLRISRRARGGRTFVVALLDSRGSAGGLAAYDKASSRASMSCSVL